MSRPRDPRRDTDTSRDSRREPLWRRYARLLGPDVAADVDDEMEFHLQLLTEKYQRQGHAPHEARAEKRAPHTTYLRIRRNLPMQ